ncbi:hypothetical protein DWV16_13765 [Anaerotruncus sp. AF02-27]|nr:hypothetical protein DWV16_13765 [Anaerotruncus sp. AF02-27]
MSKKVLKEGHAGDCALRAPGVPFLLVQERNQRRTRGDTPRPHARDFIACGKDRAQSAQTRRSAPRALRNDARDEFSQPLRKPAAPKADKWILNARKRAGSVKRRLQP